MTRLTPCQTRPGGVTYAVVSKGGSVTITIDRIDHVVVNCRDVDTTASWYHRVLGLRVEVFGPDRRTALLFGRQKLNLRPTGARDWITGDADAPGALDLCFVSPDAADSIVAHLRACGVAVVDGPVVRAGALGPMTSVYCRDPDGNLVEVANYAPADADAGSTHPDP